MTINDCAHPRLISNPHRRALLQWLASGAAAASWPERAWSQPRFDSSPFALGVASGSPTHQGVVLWTRLMQTGLFGRNTLPAEPIAVRWEVAHDEAFARIVRKGETLALPELAHSVHTEVDGLDADRWYFYRFRAGEAQSPVGRTRTLPAPDAAVQHLRLAYASCQRWEHGYYGAYRHMREETLDLVLFLGDYIYEYAGAVNAVRTTGTWATTLDTYRDRYALHKSDPALQAMHAHCPWLVTWDDHEVQNDYAGLHPGDNGPPVADFAARRAAAYQAYYEHMPLRARVLTQGLEGMARGAEMRIYGQHDFGRLARIVMLDDRQYRSLQACNPDGRPGSSRVNVERCPALADPGRELLGPEQERWLQASLTQSPSTWNLIGQQTLLGTRNFGTPDQAAVWNDGWDGYPAARQRFTGLLGRLPTRNNVVLGGDVHENWVGHVKADYTQPDSATVGVEFCGTSISSRSGGSGKTADYLARNPHFVFADAQRKGYGVLDITPQRLTATLRVVDDVTRADTGVQTLARFEVESGKPTLLRTL
ncbi:MAG: alkaline phosphatase D family protein [Rhodoferax sp.]